MVVKSHKEKRGNPLFLFLETDVAYPVPSLDGSGYINDPNIKVDTLFANYAATQYSQTILFRDKISSFSKDIQQCSQQWDKLPDFVKRSLDRLFTAYFDQVDLEVQLDEASMDANNASFKLNISGTVVQDSNQYELAKVMQVTNSRFASVTDFNLGNSKYG